MPWKVENKASLLEAITVTCKDWKPKEHQKELFENVFLKDLMYIQEEWARGGGKTSCLLKVAFIATQLFPGRLVLFVAPTKELGQKIIRNKWSEFPHHLMPSINRSSAGLIRFLNGSSLEIIGSEEDCTRGLEPVLIIYDEYAWHGSRSHLSLQPSLRKGGKLLIASTPPHLNDIETGKAKHYEDMVNFCSTNPKFASFHQVTADKVVESGIYSQEFLDITELDYISKGEKEEFQKEYWLKRIYKSQDAYFNDINDSILIPTTHMSKLVEKVSNPTWVIFGDTSGSSRWGTLFACIDEDNKIGYLVDSIVRERKGKNTSDNRDTCELTPSRFWPLLQHKMQKWVPGSTEQDWEIRWDNDTTFIDVIPLMFGDHIVINTVDKKYDKKKETFSLIRDVIKRNRLYISEDCAELIKEMKLLGVDPKTGEFTKKIDELMDCLRYMIMFYSSCFERSSSTLPLYKGNYWEYRADQHFREKTGKSTDDNDDLERLWVQTNNWESLGW